jgi:hypothetical protein
MLDDNRRKAVAAILDFNQRVSLPATFPPSQSVNLTKPVTGFNYIFVFE